MLPKSALFEVQVPAGGKHYPVPHVDEAQMREVDRIAVEVFGLGILQMMENAGRNLAALALSTLEPERSGPVVVAAGSGGNGGGGLCAARHLHNRGITVAVFFTRPTESLKGAAAAQWELLRKVGVEAHPAEDLPEILPGATLVLDALIGYSLRGAPAGITAELIEQINASGNAVISLDLPSGLDATTGETPGICIRADQTLTLALPKPGLTSLLAGELFLADIGIPPEVYRQIGIAVEPFWGSNWRLPICRIGQS